MFLLLDCRLFGFWPVGSELHMAPAVTLDGPGEDREREGGRQREFSRVTQSSRKGPKRICAYLTSPLDGEITECWAAVKSCD